VEVASLTNFCLAFATCVKTAHVSEMKSLHVLESCAHSVKASEKYYLGGLDHIRVDRSLTMPRYGQLNAVVSVQLASTRYYGSQW